MIQIGLNHQEQFSDKLCRIYDVKEGTLGATTITFQVTDACNLACSYCYQINKGKRVLSFDTAKKFIDLILSGDKGFKEYIGDCCGCILDFIGGEPFLQVELIDKIVDYFKDRALELNHPWAQNYTINISSNGTLHNTPAVQAFLEKNRTRISYNISIDGNKELHDMCRKFPDGRPSFDIAIAGARDWMSKGNIMGSKVTISPQNVSYLYQASRFMVEEGYDDININYVYEKGWTLEHAKIAYQQLKQFADYLLTLDHPEELYYAFFCSDRSRYDKLDIATNNKNWCGGDGEMIALDPDGKIFPCVRYMESSLGKDQPPLCIGDVDQGIGKCAKCKKCLDMLKDITITSQSEQRCIDCSVAGGCGWCSAYNYQCYGTLNKRATNICIVHKAASLANCYYINNLNKKFNDKDRIPVRCDKDDAISIIGENEYNMLVDSSKEN